MLGGPDPNAKSRFLKKGFIQRSNLVDWNGSTIGQIARLGRFPVISQNLVPDDRSQT